MKNGKKLLFKAVIIIAILCIVSLLYLFRGPPKLSSDITLLNLFNNLELEVQLEIRDFQDSKKALRSNLKKSLFEKISSKNFMEKVDNVLKSHGFLFDRTLAYQTAFAASEDGKRFAAVTRLTNLSSFLYFFAEVCGYTDQIKKTFADNERELYFKKDHTYLYLASSKDLLEKITCKNKEQLTVKEKIENGIYSRIFLSESLKEHLGKSFKISLQSCDKITFNIINKMNKIELKSKATLSPATCHQIKKLAKKFKIDKRLFLQKPYFINQSQLSISGNIETKILWYILNKKIFGPIGRPVASSSLPESVIFWNLTNNGIINYSSGSFCLSIGNAIPFKDSLPCPEVQFIMTAEKAKEAFPVLNYEIQNAVDCFKMPVGNDSWDSLTSETELKVGRFESELIINKLYFAGINPYFKTIGKDILYFTSHKDKVAKASFTTVRLKNPCLADINIKWNIKKEEAENWVKLIMEKAVDYYWAPKETHPVIEKYTPSIKYFAEAIPEGNIDIKLEGLTGRYYLKMVTTLNLTPAGRRRGSLRKRSRN